MDVKKLLEAGAHFGHRTSRWHPKMAPYIHSKRDGIHIIDLIKTKDLLDQAVKFVEAEAAKGNAVLFVGTKRQAKQPVKVAAEKAGMPYIIKRWLGGMLTNTDTMKGRIKRLIYLEQKIHSEELA